MSIMLLLPGGTLYFSRIIEKGTQKYFFTAKNGSFSEAIELIVLSIRSAFHPYIHQMKIIYFNPTNLADLEKLICISAIRMKKAAGQNLLTWQ